MVELLIGTPLFPGESAVDQIIEIFKVMGTPTRAQLLEMNPNYKEFKFPSIRAVSWPSVFSTVPQVPTEAMHSSAQMLQYVPRLRCSAIEACAHAFFAEIRQPGTMLPDWTAGPPLPLDMCQFTDEAPPQLFPGHLTHLANSTVAVVPINRGGAGVAAAGDDDGEGGNGNCRIAEHGHTGTSLTL